MAKKEHQEKTKKEWKENQKMLKKKKKEEKKLAFGDKKDEASDCEEDAGQEKDGTELEEPSEPLLHDHQPKVREVIRARLPDCPKIIIDASFEDLQNDKAF
jgi:hypothetical protein